MSRLKPSPQSIWYALAIAAAAVIMILWWQNNGQHFITTAPLISLGDLAGLLGAYCLLWQLVLMSRLPPLEHTFGHDRLARLHHWNGYIAFGLLLTHPTLLTIGYATSTETNILSQFVSFLQSWEDVSNAALGLLLLIGVIVLSIAIVRRRLKYETWYAVHLTTYLAILLAFGHQMEIGPDFITQPLFQAIWYILYALAFGAIGWFRFLVPLYRLFVHRFTIQRVVVETHDTISIYITGQKLHKFHFEPGQFAIWRFLAPSLWWQAHPFSLSQAYNGRELRLTAKAIGDYTRQLHLLQPGTRVLLDGPHGRFTPHHITRAKLLLIAGGIGITPLRAMLEQPPAATPDTIVLYSARTAQDIAFRSELETLSQKHGFTVHYILSQESAPGATFGLLDDALLARFVSDIPEREVFLCGPPVMMDHVAAALMRAGLHRQHIHTERFDY